jgi:hypothetical protein
MADIGGSKSKKTLHLFSIANGFVTSAELA